MPQLISAANSLADTCYQTDSHSSQSFTQMHSKTHSMPMLKIAFVSVHHHAATLSQAHHTQSSDHKVHTFVSVHHHAATLSQAHHTESSDHKVHTFVSVHHHAATLSQAHHTQSSDHKVHTFVSVHHHAATLSQAHHTVFRSQSAYFGKTTPVSIRKLQTLTTQCGNSISFSLTASGNSLHSPHYHHTTPTPNSSTSSSLKVPGRWQHSA